MFLDNNMFFLSLLALSGYKLVFKILNAAMRVELFNFNWNYPYSALILFEWTDFKILTRYWNHNRKPLDAKSVN